MLGIFFSTKILGRDRFWVAKDPQEIHRLSPVLFSARWDFCWGTKLTYPNQKVCLSRLFIPFPFRMGYMICFLEGSGSNWERFPKGFKPSQQASQTCKLRAVLIFLGIHSDLSDSLSLGKVVFECLPKLSSHHPPETTHIPT